MTIPTEVISAISRATSGLSDKAYENDWLHFYWDENANTIHVYRNMADKEERAREKYVYLMTSKTPMTEKDVGTVLFKMMFDVPLEYVHDEEEDAI